MAGRHEGNGARSNANKNLDPIGKRSYPFFVDVEFPTVVVCAQARGEVMAAVTGRSAEKSLDEGSCIQNV